MTQAERIALMQRRLAGMLGEMWRLLARYHQEPWANWVAETAEVLKSDPAEGLRIINSAYSQGEISSLTLSGEPRDPGPAWLKDQDPNAQLQSFASKSGSWRATS